MIGTSAATGRALDGLDHLDQSVADILATPIGSRPMRREYGSRVPDLLDAPMNSETRFEVVAGVAEALRRWEPRLGVDRVRVVEAAAGRLVVRIEGAYTPTGEPVVREVPVGGAA
ncbi:GPW/gp25 family protein [Ectothiorhodospira mobilis]|uniref:GPW/gp25 family protein n=1 Tax=Ectothiorhodospira mobilis TaxID=195064 RepID=UPI001906058E|nr:GPW/gp25 family protein [Ectothiorhodospira mobilis]MBK1690980.1 hypothetical protein [Ectothiorhodospira mobilis]